MFFVLRFQLFKSRFRRGGDVEGRGDLETISQLDIHLIQHAKKPVSFRAPGPKATAATHRTTVAVWRPENGEAKSRGPDD